MPEHLVKKRIIIGVLTAKKYFDRRNACLATWMSDMPPDIEPLFLIGGGQSRAYRKDHDLFLPCPDTYAELPQKTRNFCRYCLDNYDFDYLFKCDDDTYIQPKRFVEYNPEGHDYIGVDPCSHENPTFASGGAGYWLSKKAAEIVANQLTNQQGPEDLLVGQLLVKNGIKFHNDRKFQGWYFPHTIPTPENSQITVHYVRGEDMRKIHATFPK